LGGAENNRDENKRTGTDEKGTERSKGKDKNIRQLDKGDENKQTTWGSISQSEPPPVGTSRS